MKEKNEKRMEVMIAPSLYKMLKNKCDAEYQTVSSVLKRLIMNYVKEENGSNIQSQVVETKA